MVTSLGNGFYDDGNQAKLRVREPLKCRMSKINHSPLVHEAFSRAAIRHSHYHAVRLKLWVDDGHANTSAQRIEPGRSSQFVRIEFVTVGHQFAAVLLAVPRRDALLRLAPSFAARRVEIRAQPRTAAEQKHHRLTPGLSHDGGY